MALEKSLLDLYAIPKPKLASALSGDTANISLYAFIDSSKFPDNLEPIAIINKFLTSLALSFFANYTALSYNPSLKYKLHKL